MSTEATQKEEYTIDTTSVQTSFEKELKQYGDSSARIFFSGKYGVGKTKFLERFFEGKKDKYLKIHLYPVNYQISTNEDIINLLKYDILVELFEKYEEYFKTNQNIPWYVLVKGYISQKNTNEILSGTLDILEVIPVMGRLGKPLKTLLNIDKDFQKFKSMYKKGEKDLAREYLSQIKADDLTETDIISQLIKNKVNEIKSSNEDSKKKSVLIIDDLDRLDPEHIFRILNILSAHFDQGREQEGDNKFGFDYIIIVGDYNNIQSIFHHKYGKDADFDGYIDKFYTVKPFEFDNRKALLSQLPDIIKAYQRKDFSKDSSHYTYIMVEDIIRKSIDINIINLRALLKNVNLKLLSIEQKYINIPKESAHLIISIDILIDIFGTKDKLIEIIQNIRINSDTYPDDPFIPKCRKIIEQLYNIVASESLEEKPLYTYKDRTYALKLDDAKNVSIVNPKSNSYKAFLSLYYDIICDYINKNPYEMIK